MSRPTAAGSVATVTGVGGPEHRRGGLASRVVELFVLIVVLLIGTAGSASAHSEIARSDPANGGMVATGATSLTLWFDEPISENGYSFAIRAADPDKPPVDVTAKLDDGATVVHLATPPLEQGTYTISWAVIGDDGHPTRGTVIFGSGFRPDGIPDSGATLPDPFQLGIRVIDLVGTLLALGALSIVGRVAGAFERGGIRLRRRVLTLGVVGAAVSLGAGVLTPLLTIRAQVAGLSELPSAVRDLLIGSSWGMIWLVRLSAIVVALVALVRARRNPPASRPYAAPARRARVLAVATAALAVSAVIDASAGHASTLPARSGLAVLAAALHVLAAGVWAGGLLVLVLTVVPVMRLQARERRAVVPDAWKAFGPRAALASGVLVATGLYGAGRHVGSVTTLTHDVYGWAVIAKVLLLCVALAIAGYNTMLINPEVAERVGRLARQGEGWRPPAHRLRTTVAVEAAVLVAAVAGAAVMTSVPTARESDATASILAPYSDTVDGLFVTFEALPLGQRTRIVVRSEAVVRPLPGPVTSVEVGLVPGAAPEDRVDLKQVQPGQYEGVTAQAPTGDWIAEVVLHRGGTRDSVLDVPWWTGSTTAATPLEWLGSAVALVMLLGIGSGVLLWRRRIGGPDIGPAEEEPADLLAIEDHDLEEAARS